jgi:hypothetical protein
MTPFGVAACSVALILLLAAEASGRSASDSRRYARCATGTVPAVIAGKHVCLKAGQRCSPKREAVYRRYGFTCTRRHRLARLVRSQLARSLYRSVSEERRVDERTVLLAAPLDLPKRDAVFVEADGTFAPATGDAAASISIHVDATRVSNVSTIDWRGSVDPVRHSFNVVGVVPLSAGHHTAELVGQPLAGSFTIGASSNLSVLVHPAQHVGASQLGAEAGPFDYTTLGRLGPDLPHAPLVTRTADVRRPTVAIASATGRRAAHDGDGMLGIYLDGKHPGPESSLWTVNDICTCAEVEAPMFTHALLRDGRRSSSVSLDATEFPWSIPPPAREDPAIFTVQPSATLVVLNGGMQLVGAARSLLPFFPNDVGTVSDGWCIGTSSGWSGCPSVGTNVLLAQARIAVPAGHPGVVMLLAKTRVQGDESDRGGNARLWLTVDGKPRGSVGVQQLAEPFSVSGRTIAASYLAAGSERLRPGTHVVRVYGRAEGSFVHLVYLRDLPLLWFD